MRKSIAGLAALFALAIVAGPVAAESGVVTLGGGEEAVVATMTLNQGDVVEWTYSAGLNIEFSVEKDGTEVYSSGTMAGTGTFTASAAGTYTFKFKNTGTNIMPVSYDLKKRVDATPILLGVGAAAAAAAGLGGFALYRKRKATAGQAPPPPTR